jgi:hypothetical protein
MLLVLLVVLLGAVAYRLWPRATTGGQSTAAHVRGAARSQPGPPVMRVPDVRLEALNEERSKPTEVDRDLFQFKPKPAPPPPPAPPAKPAPAAPTGPPPPPQPPPIALKFIGIWELTEQKKKIAVLSDGKGGVPIYGSEGEVIEGRYRILKIGAESIEMAYLDGRGRQTIRLTGQ